MYQGKPIAPPQTMENFQTDKDLMDFIKGQMEWGRQILITPEDKDITTAKFLK